MDPAPFTLRSLLRMVESNQKTAWVHTSHVLWIVAETNRHRTDRKRPYDPREFNPMFAGSVPKGNPLTKDRLRAQHAAYMAAQEAKKAKGAK